MKVTVYVRLEECVAHVQPSVRASASGAKTGSGGSLHCSISTIAGEQTEAAVQINPLPACTWTMYVAAAF